MIKSIILAAGQGTRMKSQQYKVLHPVLGKPMLSHVIDNLSLAEVDRKVIVVGHGAEKVKETIGVREDVEFVLQSEQLGTGHAVMMAENILKDEEGVTLVVCGDTPLITPTTLSNLIEFHRSQKAVATILTTDMGVPTGYGRIIRNINDEVVKIVEEKDADDDEKKVKEINTGTYCFDNQQLFKALKSIKNDNNQGEYYLTDVVEILKNQSQKVMAYKTLDSDETLGINDRVALAKASQILKRRVNESLMRQGVTLIDPENTYISVDSHIGRDTVVYPGTVIMGHNTIGENCILGPNTELTNVTVDNDVEIKHSVVSDSTIGQNTTVGPFAHIRNHAQIGQRTRVGNFVEVKNTTLGNDSKSAHLSYLGDAQIGERVNIGCGSITVNYDGKNKYKTVVEDDAFIGCNTNLIAPVTVGKNTLVAAGSTITDDVPDNSLAIARSRQVNKERYRKNSEEDRNNKALQ